MAGNFQEDSVRSRRLFDTSLKARILALLPGAIYPVEGEMHPTLQMLDMLSGIDHLHYSPAYGTRGIASRVQTVSSSFQTFTVRESRATGAKTELAKRQQSLSGGGLGPSLTVQAYFSPSEKLLAFAVAKQSDILALIDAGVCRWEQTGADQIGQATFAYVKWNDFAAQDRSIIIYNGLTDKTFIHYAGTRLIHAQ